MKTMTANPFDSRVHGTNRKDSEGDVFKINNQQYNV
jgi:hypothetical protein